MTQLLPVGLGFLRIEWRGLGEVRVGIARAGGTVLAGLDGDGGIKGASKSRLMAEVNRCHGRFLVWLEHI